MIFIMIKLRQFRPLYATYYNLIATYIKLADPILNTETESNNFMFML